MLNMISNIKTEVMTVTGGNIGTTVTLECTPLKVVSAVNGSYIYEDIDFSISENIITWLTDQRNKTIKFTYYCAF